jgi:hypothetical protein
MSVVEDLDNNVTAGEAVMVIYCTRQKLLREHIEMVGCTKKVKKKVKKAKSKKQWQYILVVSKYSLAEEI